MEIYGQSDDGFQAYNSMNTVNKNITKNLESNLEGL